MNKFTIYCTPEQTKIAFELDAPIFSTSFSDNGIHQIFNKDNRCYYDIPTAKQMIGLLEGKEILIDVEMRTGIVYVYDRLNKVFIKSIKIPSRPEAIRAGIDAALKYLKTKC